MTTSPVTRNIIANFFKIFVLFVNQILLVPAYLHYWGIELYSDWLVLSAITSFFTMSDVGLNNVTNNLFCIRFAENKQKECNILLTNYLIFIHIVFLSIFILCLFISFFIDLRSILGLHVISHSQSTSICLVFILQMLIQMSGGVFDCIYNANHLASKATYINNITRLLYSLIIFLGLITHLKISIIVLLGIIPYIIATIYKYVNSKILFTYHFQKKDFQIKFVRSLIKPSIGFMFFPLGNVILFQGFTILINIYLGATILVLFNTTRTMMNFIRNMVQAISSAIKPEFAIEYGKKDYNEMQLLYKKSILYCTIATMLSIISLLLGGEFIYTIWLDGAIQFNIGLVSVFSAILFVNMLWESSCIVLTATNNHFKLSSIYIVSSFISVLSALICLEFNLGIIEVSWCLIITDVIMAYYSLKKSSSLLKYKIWKNIKFV